MNNLQIFEPAMCCDTGLCGVSVDPELIRITTVIDALKKNGITVERYNLSSTPQVFVTHKMVNHYILEKGVEALPMAVFDGAVVTSGRYPTNAEFAEMLNLPMSYFGEQDTLKGTTENSEDCCCSGGTCCE